MTIVLQQKKHYEKLKASALLIQAFVRGWKVMGKGGGFPPHTWFLQPHGSSWIVPTAGRKE